MKTLIKQISLLIISGLILPILSNNNFRSKHIAAHLKIAEQVVKPQALTSFTGYWLICDELTAALFPLLKN